MDKNNIFYITNIGIYLWYFKLSWIKRIKGKIYNKLTFYVSGI